MQVPHKSPGEGLQYLLFFLFIFAILHYESKFCSPQIPLKSLSNLWCVKLLLRLCKFEIHHKGPQVSYAGKFMFR